jgi:2-oxo-3-hexenedioate decarboxylase
MSDPRVPALARELLEAFDTGAHVPIPPSARDGGIDLDTGYAVEAEIVRLRRAAGHQTVGRKIGLASRAVWRLMGIKTVIWGNMYDDTVQYARNGGARQSVGRMRAPRIEPEIVVRLKTVPAPSDAAGVMRAVEWMALGFEIVDCPFPDWKFQPGDFLASLGLHAALIVGEPRALRDDDVPAVVNQLATFTARLLKNGQVVAEGGGKNVLESPALCLAEFVSAVSSQRGVEPLRPGELISTGSTTAAQPVAAGERWTMEVDGLDLPPLTVDLTP